MRWTSWLIREHFKDVFGFGNFAGADEQPKEKADPLKTLKLQEIAEYLSKQSIGIKRPYLKFINEIHWGDGHGAIRVRFGSGWKVMMERQVPDLTGNPCWVCKKVYQVDRTGAGGTEVSIAEAILDELQTLDKSEPDSALHEYKDLEDLALYAADCIKKTAKDIFLFDGVRKVNDHHYIVRLGVRGQGVEAPDHHRVEENQTRLTYDEKTGLIRIANYNLESRVGAHEWFIMPSDTDWYFSPKQSKDEIAETIATCLRWY